MITPKQINELRKNRTGTVESNRSSVSASDISKLRKRMSEQKAMEQEAKQYSPMYVARDEAKRKELNTPVVMPKRDYTSIQSLPDFAEKSKSAGEKPGYLYETFKDTLFDWGQFDKKEKNISTLVERGSVQSYTGAQGIGNLDDTGLAIKNMSDTDKGIYNYIFNTEGKGKADEYLKDYVKSRSKASTEKLIQDAKEFSKENPVLGSIASVAATPAKWLGMYDTVFDRSLSKEINPYGAAFMGTNFQEAAREGVTEDMGNVGKFLYSAGMSTLDSLLASATGSPWAGALMLAGGAGSDSVKDAKERGATDNQALLSGLASGTAEALFERISLGNLQSLKEVPIKSVKDIAKNTVKSMFTNASEEAATELSNTITDYIIMQDLSNYNLAYQNYINAGMDDKTAHKMASKDMAKQIGLSALAGALSGGVMAGAGQGVNYYRGSRVGSSVDVGEVDTMVDKAKSSESPDLYQLALEIERRKQSNKQPTNYQKGRLAVETYNAPINSLQSEETAMTTRPKETITQEDNKPKIENKDVKNAPVTWNSIEGAKVKGISKVENNVAKVTVETGGETIVDTLNNVVFDNPEIKAIYDYAEQYKTNGAKSFVSNYNNNIDIEAFKKGFDAYYDAGLVDIPMNKVHTVYGELLSESAKYSAYESGKNDAIVEVSKISKTDITGIIETDASKNMDAGSRESLDLLGKSVGVKIQIEESLAGGQANGLYKDGTLFIALDSDNPYMVVAKHELTHSLQESSPDLYKKYKDFVISEINKTNPKAYNEMVDRLISRYSEIGETLTRDQAQDEIVADATEMFFTDGDIISRLANEDKNLAEKVIEFIKELITKIQNALQGTEPRSRAAIVLNDNLEVARQAEKLWVDALANKTSDKAIAQGKKYSLKDSKGRELTKEQHEYFKNSKVRDDKGNLLVAYHGTNADFTVFSTTFDKEGNGAFWLSKNRDYSEELASIRNGDKIIEAYVNITNPLYVTMNTQQFSDYVEEKHYIEQAKREGNDGVIFTNDTDNEILKDTFYAVFESNQIKTVDNINPSKELDIRYQLKDVDPVAYNEAIKENIKLKEINNLLKSQFQLTKEIQPNRKQLEKKAKEILKMANSSYSVESLVDNLETIWKFVREYAAEDDSQLYTDEAIQATQGMAVMILKQSSVTDNSLVESSKDMLKYIKKTPIMISAKDRGDLASEGGINQFRKKYIGRIRIVGENGTPVDTFYKELVELYPEHFDEDVTHPADQLIKIADVIDFIKPINYNPYGMDIEEAARDLAYEMISTAYFNINEAPPTFADKKRIELEKLKMKYNKKVREVRNEYREKYNERLQNIRKDSAQKIAELKEKSKTASAEEREAYNERITKLKDENLHKLKAQQDRFNERMEMARARRERRAEAGKYKDRIRAISKDLSNMLLRSDDKKHIPAGLKGSIIQVCQLLDFETGRKGPQGEPTQVSEKLRSLQAQYAKLASEIDDDISSFYDDDMSIALNELADTTQGRRINQLSHEELQQVYNIMRHIRHIVSLENKMFNDTLKETIAVAGEGQIMHHNSSKEFKQMDIVAKNKALKAFSDLLGKGNLKPYYFFKQLGGNLQTLYKGIRDGEDSFVRNFEKGKDYAKEIINRYDYFSWAKDDKPQEFKTSKGESISLTTGEKLYIYMAYQREQGKGHILSGGIVPSSQVSKKGKTSEQSKPIQFTEKDIINLTNSLTDEQIGFAKEMGEYLSNDLAKLGNEVSLKMYGYEKFTEKNYIPLTSDPNFYTTKAGALEDRRIKRSGFTKAITPKAGNPIIAADFLEVWSKHLTDMSMYNAFVLPITDFERVWNYRVKDKTGKVASVKASIQNEYGRRANDYIKNLLNDINGGIKAPVGGELFGIFLAKMKAEAVMGNLSVAIQQPSSIARAMVIINPKYFVKTTFSKRGYNELLKHSPQAVLKQYGYFDVNMGRNLTDLITQPDYDGLEKFKAFFTDKNVRNEVFSWLPQKMDEITWSHIWNAVKAETKAETKLVEGTDEFYQHVAERFKEVIDRSQVMDSVFQRSEIMRSQNQVAKLVTNFMSEPTVSYNMLFDAISEYKKKGKSASPYVARTVVSIISAMVLNSLLKSIVTALRDKDEDKDYVEKYLDGFINNLADDPLSMIPYARDVYSIFQGYNINRLDMQLVQNLYYAWEKLKSDKYSTSEKVLNLAQAIAPTFNVPLRNISKDIESIFRNGADVLEKVGLTEALPEYERLKLKYDINDLENSKGTSEYYNYLYSIKGTEEYNEVYKDLLRSGRKPSNIEQAMTDRKRLELFSRKKDEEYTHPLVIEAVDAMEKNDTKSYESAIIKLQKEYTDKDILAAINSLKSERAKADAPTVQEWIDAYNTGKSSIWDPIAKKMRDAGYTDKDLLELVK